MFVCVLLDIDDHGDTVAFYLVELSRENIVALGEALGLNANSLHSEAYSHRSVTELAGLYLN